MEQQYRLFNCISNYNKYFHGFIPIFRAAFFAVKKTFYLYTVKRYLKNDSMGILNYQFFSYRCQRSVDDGVKKGACIEVLHWFTTTTRTCL